MKKIRSIFVTLFSGLLIFAASSCTSEIVLTQNNDNSVSIKFSAQAGEFFEKMVKAAAADDGEIFYKEDEIVEELKNAGFSDIAFKRENLIDVNVFMKDKDNASLLSKTGLINKKSDSISVNITAEKMQKFYDSADEQMIMILDMFLAPVFNGEEMDEAEYLEILGSFYGQDVVNELKDNYVKITVISKNGKKVSNNVTLSKLFTLKDEINL